MKIFSTNIYGEINQKQKLMLKQIKNIMLPEYFMSLKAIYFIKDDIINDGIKVNGIWVGGRDKNKPMQIQINNKNYTLKDTPFIIIDVRTNIDNFAFVFLHELGHHVDFINGCRDDDSHIEEIQAHKFAIKKFILIDMGNKKVSPMLYLTEAINELKLTHF